MKKGEKQERRKKRRKRERKGESEHTAALASRFSLSNFLHNFFRVSLPFLSRGGVHVTEGERIQEWEREGEGEDGSCGNLVEEGSVRNILKRVINSLSLLSFSFCVRASQLLPLYFHIFSLFWGHLIFGVYY